MRDFPLNDKVVNYRLQNINKNIRKKSTKEEIFKVLFLFTPYFLIGVSFLISGLIILILNPKESNMGQNLFFIIGNLVLFAFILLIYSPFFISTFIAYKRTLYNGFLFEFLNEIQFFISLFLITSIGILKVGFYFFPLIIGINIVLLPLYVHNHVKKPLIHNSFSLGLEKDNPGIVVKQSLFVNGFSDGYSSRPVFADISKIITETGNENNLRDKIKEFASFVAKNGDLIGFDLIDNKLIMYLRTTLIQRFQMDYPIAVYQKLKLIINKEKLTAVNIDLNNWEISFRLNEYDYKALGNITYHQLSERILTQFIKSLNEFIKGDISESLSAIDPTFKLDNYYKPGQKLGYFIAIFYIAGMLIVGYSTSIFIPSYQSISAETIGLISLFWPFLLLYYLVTNILVFLILAVLVYLVATFLFKIILSENIFPWRN